LVTTKGLLDSDQIESDISVFDLEEIFAFLNDATREPPKPRVIATVISFPHREEANAYAAVIKDLRWSPDSTSVYFKGENPTGAYQLYVAKLDVSEFHASLQQPIVLVASMLRRIWSYTRRLFQARITSLVVTRSIRMRR
jgi:hypothetical protein